MQFKREKGLKTLVVIDK
jgi:hypothetical protein